MELKEQKFGIEIEMTGITRAKAAEVTAEYFGTRVKYLGTYYDTYAAIDTEGRQWKFMSDGSITAQKKSNGRKINAGREYQTEMVSPICRYEDIGLNLACMKRPIEQTKFHCSFLKNRMKVQTMIAAIIIMLVSAALPVIPDPFHCLHTLWFSSV